MEIQVKKLPDSKREIEIELSFPEFEPYLEKATLDLAKDLERPGFRKGKIPKKLIEKEIGKEKILSKALELAIEENYFKAILENKIKTITQPEIELLKIPLLDSHLSPMELSSGCLRFLARVEVLPEVQLPDYKEIARQCQKKKISVSEKEIEETLKWLQRSRAKFSLKNQPAEKGDFVEIEYFSPQIENGKIMKDAFILGEGHFIPGFEEKLIGLRDGQEREEFSLPIPKDHFRKDLVGKEMTFKVRMISVQKMELPELTDEFARGLGQFENLNMLKKSIEEGVYLEKELEESQKRRQEILEKICQASRVEIPKTLLEREQNQLLENLKKDFSQGLKIYFQDYLQQIREKEEDLKALCLSLARKRIKEFLVLNEISEREDIQVTDEEIRSRINEKIKHLDLEKTKEIDLEKLKVYTKEEIKQEKTLKMLEDLTTRV